jgi:hypothetical protein
VGVIAIVSVVPLAFVAVFAPLGVRVAVAPMRVVALTLAPAGRKRNGERKGKKSSENRRGPAAVHGVDWFCECVRQNENPDYGRRIGCPMARSRAK